MSEDSDADNDDFVDALEHFELNGSARGSPSPAASADNTLGVAASTDKTETSVEHAVSGTPGPAGTEQLGL